jgi:hypothetical protein
LRWLRVVSRRILTEMFGDPATMRAYQGSVNLTRWRGRKAGSRRVSRLFFVVGRRLLQQAMGCS